MGGRLKGGRLIEVLLYFRKKETKVKQYIAETTRVLLEFMIGAVLDSFLA